jgi:hypothetical protein
MIEPSKSTLPVWGAVLFACEVFTSWWLWGSFPTDTTAAYYPTMWSYVGEHLVMWIVPFLGLVALIALPHVRRRWLALTVLQQCGLVIAVAAVLELLSSGYRWHLTAQDGVVSPWWRGGLSAYIVARLRPLFSALLVTIGIVLLRIRMQAKVRNLPE